MVSMRYYFPSAFPFYSHQKQKSSGVCDVADCDCWMITK